MNDWEAPFYIYEQSDEHKEIEALEAKLSLKESQLAIAKEALRDIQNNSVPGGHDQTIAREALEKLK